MLENRQTYFKNLVMLIPEDFRSIMHGMVNLAKYYLSDIRFARNFKFKIPERLPCKL